MSRNKPLSKTEFECVGGGAVDGVIVDIDGADPRKPFVFTHPATGTRSVYRLVGVNDCRPQLVFIRHEPATVRA